MSKITVQTSEDFLNYGVLAKGEDAFAALDGTLIFERPVLMLGPRRLRNCTMGAFSIVQTTAGVYPCKIGRYAGIGEQSTVGPGEHPVNWLSTHPFAFTRPNILPYFYKLPEFAQLAPTNAKPNEFKFPLYTTVGHDAWVCANSFVKRGVTIGHGAIVAAGAVVTKDVPPYAVVGGSPGKIMRMRFPDKLIERLLQFQWWQYDLAPHKEVIDFSKPDVALDKLEDLLAAGTLKKLIPETFKLTRAAMGYELEKLPSPLY
jgi:acetyltransferase-like isoleucine patch superfamily enzyme